MQRKVLAYMLICAIVLLPLTNVSAGSNKKFSTTPNRLGLVRVELPEGIQLNHISQNQVSLGFTKSQLSLTPKKTRLGSINYTRIDSGDLNIKLVPRFGKSVDVSIKSIQNGRFSLRISRGETITQLEYTDIEQIKSSKLLNEFSKKLVSDFELVDMLKQSNKLLTDNNPIANCVDDGCAFTIFLCVGALIGTGATLASIVGCPATAGLGCVLGGLGVLIFGAVGAGASCDDVESQCANKTTEQTGVYADNGHIYIAWEPIILDDFDVNCNDPLVDCHDPKDPTIEPVAPIQNE